MFEFKLSRADQDEATLFDLGNMRFFIDGVEIANRNCESRRMMIYLTLQYLINDLVELRINRGFQLLSIDISFFLNFRLEKRGLVMFLGGKVLGICDFKSFLQTIDLEVDRFLNDGNGLDVNDLACIDFYNSVKRLKAAVST